MKEGMQPARGSQTEIRVRYAECDPMGVVHHSNYPIWFEAARSTFCRERGIDYAQLERDGYAMPVLELHCRFIKPAYYEDLVVVRTWPKECRHSLLRMGYEVWRGEELLTEAETLQMLIERASGKPRRFSEELYERFMTP